MKLTVTHALTEQPEVLEEVLRDEMPGLAAMPEPERKDLLKVLAVIADRVVAFGELGQVVTEIATVLAVAEMERDISSNEKGGHDGPTNENN